MAKSMLKKNHVITKSNALNEMRANNMSLQELRLLSVYMSKINPKDKSISAVSFSLDDFHAIMDVEMRGLRANYYVEVAERLLSKIIKLTSSGGFVAFQLFKRVKFTRENSESPYYFEIEAHEDALPLLFDLRSNYFKYELWNALCLKGKNQLRMYEILKQYEWCGHRIISIPSLKEQLGIGEDEYFQYKIFNRDVLESCQKALAELTDISYTYEVHSKKNRKTYELKFTIIKNKSHKDPLSLGDFIDMKQFIENDTISDEAIDFWDMDEDHDDYHSLSKYQQRLIFLRDAVGSEFSKEEMIVLSDLLADKVPHIFRDEIKCFKYICRKYNEVNLKDSKGLIRSRFGYLKSLIGTE